MDGELGVGACKGGRAVATPAHPVCLQRSWPHPCLGFGCKKPWLAAGLDQKSGFFFPQDLAWDPASSESPDRRSTPKDPILDPKQSPKSPPRDRGHTKSLSWGQSCSNKDQPDTSFRHGDNR